MAETIVSPGVVTNENDQSFITQQPTEAGAAIIGPSSKGPVEIPTIVTSWSEYQNIFGDTFISGGQSYSYFTAISAYNYFQNGNGTTLLVTRVTSGSFTSATSSTILSTGPTASSNVFTLKTLSEGEIMNSTSSINTDGSLPSGSVDNVRWQITDPDTVSGTFSLLIRKGNDNTNSPTVLETWSNLSLDPTEPNYIEKVIGNQSQTIAQDGTDYYVKLSGNYENKSRYVRVDTVNLKTPNYLDNTGTANNAYTSSIPIASSGSFGSAVGSNISTAEGKYYENITNTNIQGLSASDYDQSISLLTNKDEYKYDYITTPGLIYDASNYAAHYSVLNTLMNNCRSRGDVMTIIDITGYNAQLTTATSNISSVDNSYVATYWPWLKTLDPFTGEQLWVPASVMLPQVYAFNDSISYPWMAPAGTSRGRIATANAERNLTQTNRNNLYKVNINAIATKPGVPGAVVFGQKTLQKRNSALDRVNVRRLLIELKSKISQFADGLLFEQNTQSTRDLFLNQVNPYLASVVELQGLTGFQVVMDDTNNASRTIDDNQLIGQIYIQPTKTIEFIMLDFNLTPTGVTFN